MEDITMRKNAGNAAMLKILLLEDSPADAEMIEDWLKKGGLEFTMEIVDTGEGYGKALKEFVPDIILGDYHLPLFDGPFALAIAREKYPDIPFIFVTGALGEEKAVETLLKGATDYVLKDNLSRLVPAITRALQEKKLMRERHLLFAALKENEERYRSLVEDLPVGIFRTTVSQPGRFLQANMALARMHGAGSVEELLRTPLSDLYADSAVRETLINDIMKYGSVKGREILYNTKSGGTVWGSITAACHRNTAGEIDWIEGIIEDVTERRNSQDESKRTLLQQEGVNQLQQSLLAPAPLDQKLKNITDSIVRIFDADFCRIWMIRPGDLCEEGCIHALVHEGPHVCRYRDRCLHLMSSSGRYTHTDGEGHRRVPFGCYKIGLVASGEEHKFITNDAQNEPRVHNHEWARKLGLVSFAGYQLLVPGEETLGVLALFARHPFSPAEDAMLDGLSSTVALIIQQAKENEALKISEEKFRNLIESSRDAIMLMEPPAWGFTTGNPASVAMFREEGLETLILKPPWKLSPEYQPGGRPSADMAMEMIDRAMREGSNLFEWIHRRSDGENFPAEILLTRVEVEGKQLLQATIRDITGRKQAENELRRKNEELDLLVNSIASIIIGVSVKDRITHWNPFAEKVLGLKSRDMMGTRLTACTVKWEWNRIYEAISLCISEDRNVRLDDVKYVKKNGSDGILGLTVNPLKRGGDVLEGFIILGRDLTEQRIMENHLLQAHKLEAIGQLAAGVAHEINSPLQYVGDNLKFMIKSIEDIMELQKMFIENMEAAADGRSPLDAAGPLRKYMADIDLEYLIQELPKAAEQSLDGIERVSKIVQSMKAFAHPGTGTKSPADINKSIENMVTVSRNEWKYDSELQLDLDPSLPTVPCFEAELNQVVLNLVVNAVYAIKEAKGNGSIEKGLITISTREEGGYAVIRIEDNGPGIPEKIIQKVFDPFFTTKEVGKGTGQGLAISHSIITEKHGGMIYCENGKDFGAAFIIRLPLDT